MNLNQIIYSLYTVSPKSIETVFVLFYEEKIVVKGKAIIEEYSDIIRLTGKCEDIDFRKFIGENKISININDIPRYYSCELINFPTKDIKANFVDKNIIINLPKVKIDSNFSFSMSYNISRFDCDMTPLYEMETRKLCDIIII